jgi:hypothetical protein
VKRAGALWILVVSSRLVPALGCGSSCEGAAGSTPCEGISHGEAIDDGILNGAPAAEPPLPWIPLFDDMNEWGREVEYAQICEERSCPTLEEVLVSNTDCSAPGLGPGLLGWGHPQIVTGCGMIQVHIPGSATYWYEGFGSPPVAVGDWGAADTGGARWGTTRSLACARNEQVVCSVCDDGYPACGEPSNWLPEVPTGCACEPDGEDAARVSLDCFCSLYNCPSYSAAVHDCKVEPFDRRLSTRQAHDGCGQTSFGSDWSYHGNQYQHSYDAVTGRLMAAEFSMDAPVAWPCFTSRITAGSAVACPSAVDCGCNPPAPAETLNRCDDESWFQTLVDGVPDEP